MGQAHQRRRRLLAKPRNLHYLLSRRTDFVRQRLKPGQRVLEVGAGLGIASLYLPDAVVVSTDVVAEPWLSAAADAMQLPFRGESFDAVVCLNVLHHLSHPGRGLAEMLRVLRCGGKLFIAEPHVSLALRAALAVTGHEVVDWRVNPFNGSPCQPRQTDPTCGNNAIGDLLFGDLRRFRGYFPQLELEHHRFVECMTFLNSGGVSCRTPFVPLPNPLLRAVGWLDDRLARYPRWFPIGRELIFKKTGGRDVDCGQEHASAESQSA